MEEVSQLISYNVQMALNYLEGIEAKDKKDFDMNAGFAKDKLNIALRQIVRCPECASLRARVESSVNMINWYQSGNMIAFWTSGNNRWVETVRVSLRQILKMI